MPDELASGPPSPEPCAPAPSFAALPEPLHPAKINTAAVIAKILIEAIGKLSFLTNKIH
jgi:hypothetical protein